MIEQYGYAVGDLIFIGPDNQIDKCANKGDWTHKEAVVWEAEPECIGMYFEITAIVHDSVTLSHVR